jgi:hypothetical protein
MLDPTPKRTTEQKVIVYKTLVDPITMRLTVEKVKTQLYSKYGLLKPSPEDIQILSLDKEYEPYTIVDGKYTMDYYRKRTYTIPVDEKVLEINILSQTPKLQKIQDLHGKTIRVEAEERLNCEEKAYLVLDRTGREVSPQLVPSAPFEENPQTVLSEIEKTQSLQTPNNSGIDILRTKIVRRPKEIERINQETFEIKEDAVIYTPVYKVKFQNQRTGEIKVVKFDAVTAHRIL